MDGYFFFGLVFNYSKLCIFIYLLLSISMSNIVIDITKHSISIYFMPTDLAVPGQGYDPLEIIVLKN